MTTRGMVALALLLVLAAPSIAQDRNPAGRIAVTFYQAQGSAQRSKAAAAMPDTMIGPFKVDPEAPIHIEADKLVEIFDGQAVFSGDVKLRQGDFLLRTAALTAFYSGQSDLRRGEERRAEQLTRAEAKEGVLITSKNGQTATGQWGAFDVMTNTVLLEGRVIVTRTGVDPLKLVVMGEQLKVDLTTGMYRFEIDKAPTPQQPAGTQIKPQ